MKGDFSRWQDHPDSSFSGVLHQQGRVLLDRDWNDQVRITSDWQENMGRVMLGHDAVAVPEEQFDSSFKVTTAVMKGSQVQLTLGAGNAWLNGHSLFMKNNDIVATLLPATEYQPLSATNGYQAVILEMWEEPVNGYQNSNATDYALVEPALGGPDTTERMQRCLALCLVETDGTEDGGKIFARVKDDLTKKGRLAAGLQSSTPTSDPGTCPTSLPGGYTGFEHNLYRIEIAQTDAAAGAMFKWSRYNGGLTGQGTFSTQPESIRIEANLPAISAAGNDTFYVEIVQRDSADLHWEVVYGAVMSYSEGQLTLQTKWFGAASTPSANTPVFFRLWDGIGQVGDYPIPSTGQQPQVLQDGITLAFDPENKAAGNYRPGDFWTFPVRVGQAGGTTLLPAQPPQGIVYHRAALAVLQWNAGQSNQTLQTQNGDIRDLRVFFRPLTKIQTGSGRTCCTLTVSNQDKSLQGDYDSLEAARDHLDPSEGGQICLLPGEHVIDNPCAITARSNIRVYGCGRNTVVKAKNADAPVLVIKDSFEIQVDHLMFYGNVGNAITVDQTNLGIGPQIAGIRILNNIFITEKIAIDIQKTVKIVLADNQIYVQDGATDTGVGIYLQANDAVVERNTVEVFGQLVEKSNAVIFQPPTKYHTSGGIQVGSNSQNISVRKNKIQGGAGHGICLGSLPPADAPGTSWPYFINSVSGCADFENQFFSFLYDVRIEDNDISGMDQNGIGVPALFLIGGCSPYFFNLCQGMIARNRISNCLSAADTTLAMTNALAGTWAGIALAGAEEVVIQDNQVSENGTDKIGVCGIFILLAEKVSLEDNVLLNNGAFERSAAEVESFDIHGGVVVRMAFHPGLAPASQTLAEGLAPAITLRGNKIVQPLGPALSLTAMGPVVAIQNHFVSRGLLGSTFMSYPYNSFFGTNYFGVIRVVNIGLPRDSFHPSFAFSWLQLPKLNTAMVQNTTPPSATASYPYATGPISDPGDKRAWQYKLLPRGQVLWSENTVYQDTLNLPSPEYLCASQFIATYDDLAYVNNYTVCASPNCYTYFNAMLFASTLRVAGNRFEEGYDQAFYSLAAIGTLNTVVENQSTHSLITLGSPGQSKLVVANNTVVVEQYQQGLDSISAYLKTL